MKSKKSGSDISKPLPAAPDHGNPGFTVAFAIEKATELGNPAGGLVNGRLQGVGERTVMMKMI